MKKISGVKSGDLAGQYTKILIFEFKLFNFHGVQLIAISICWDAFNEKIHGTTTGVAFEM